MRLVIRLTTLSMLMLPFLLLRLPAQGNIDWEQRWLVTPPTGQSQHPFSWMNDSLAYTRLAYDETREVVYVVSPHRPGMTMWSAPSIHILDAQSGQPRTDLGRSAHFTRRGLGGELPVPLDTFMTATNTNLGFGLNWFALYNIDVDEEGRIYACNLVDPLWGICLLQPTGLCDSMYLHQGPFRVWRWDTPSSTPELIYATCNATHDSIGSITSSEMPYARWGDGFAVDGGRRWYQPPAGGPPVLVDSTRLYVTSGQWPGGTGLVGSVAVLVPDTRDSLQRPQRDVFGSGRLSYRLGMRMDVPAAAAAHGIALGDHSFSGDTLQRWIWLRRHGENLYRVRERHLLTAPLPRLAVPSGSDVQFFSSTNSLFGPSGAMAHLSLPAYGRSFLAVADARPTSTIDPTIPNDNTTGRLVDVTIWGSFFQVWGPTPRVGSAAPQSIGPGNYITDIDLMERYYTPQERPDGPGHLVSLFLLFSNNGIACYRSRPVPVELLFLAAMPHADGARVAWMVTAEVNIQSYLVERGPGETGPWQVVGSVMASGGTGDLRYALDDRSARSGTRWYRLTAVEFDGTRKTWPAVRLDGTTAAPSFEALLFPQPVAAGDAVYLRLRTPVEETYRLRVTDVIGREMLPTRDITTQAGETLLSLDATRLRAGLYLVELRKRDGATRVLRLLVR
ncbi:MAG: hypothetical protein KFF77_09980 [Bacteroidetes bacterium]|nr:hypothetical protein [Bacteroidota bacterium]